MSDFSTAMHSKFPLLTTLDHLAIRASDALLAATAGVTIVLPGVHRYIAASCDAARLYERLNDVLGEGPRTQALITGEAVLAGNVADDDRFPQYGRRLRSLGIGGVFAFPLCRAARCVGVLGLYQNRPAPLSTRDEDVAGMFAAVLASCLINAEVQDARRNRRERSTEPRTTGRL